MSTQPLMATNIEQIALKGIESFVKTTQNYCKVKYTITAKTLFYDRDEHGNPPDISIIKAEVSPSTIVTRLIFNQNELLPLYVNDLVDVWYEGKLYSGYIADRVKTEFNDRLIFVESGNKPNVI